MFNRNTTSQILGYAIAAIAGIWTLAYIILGLTNSTVDIFWNNGLLILFVLALILAFVQFAQERAALKTLGTGERFPEPAIARFFLASDGSSPLWFVVRMYVGAEWLLAGWEKIQSPAWGTSGVGLKGFVEGALKLSAGAHPSVQGWYAWFLQNTVLPNASLFSFMVTWGEFAVGLGVLFGVLTGIAAGFGVLMNFNYLLAGTVSINPPLGVLGLFLVLSWRVAGWIGIDRILLPAIGLPWKPGTLFRSADHEKQVAAPAES